MFSLFKKKTAAAEPPLKKKIKDMKCRKVNYVDEDFEGLCSKMSADPSAILSLKPVNYYAIKTRYIMGKLYTNEDFSENYVQFFRYDTEHEVGKSDIFPIDAVLLSKALAKVGIIIDLKKAESESES